MLELVEGQQAEPDSMSFTGPHARFRSGASCRRHPQGAGHGGLGPARRAKAAPRALAIISATWAISPKWSKPASTRAAIRWCHTVWCAGDVGSQIINPHGALNQVHGSIIEGIGHATQLAVEIEGGAAVPIELPQYQLPRMPCDAGNPCRIRAVGPCADRAGRTGTAAGDPGADQCAVRADRQAGAQSADRSGVVCLKIPLPLAGGVRGGPVTTRPVASPHAGSALGAAIVVSRRERRGGRGRGEVGRTAGPTHGSNTAVFAKAIVCQAASPPAQTFRALSCLCGLCEKPFLCRHTQQPCPKGERAALDNRRPEPPPPAPPPRGGGFCCCPHPRGGDNRAEGARMFLLFYHAKARRREEAILTSRLRAFA